MVLCIVGERCTLVPLLLILKYISPSNVVGLITLILIVANSTFIIFLRTNLYPLPLNIEGS